MLYVDKTANTFSSFDESYGATTRPNINGFGALVTPSIVSLELATWTQLIAAVAKDSHVVHIGITNNNGAGESRETVIDIGIDPAGGTSYTTIIPELLCGGASPYTGISGGSINYVFPIAIPAGASVAARGFGTVITSFNVFAYLYSEPMNKGGMMCGSYVHSLGITGNNGVSVVPGTTSEGAWTSIGTTASSYWAVEWGVQNRSTDISWAAAGLHLDVAVGDATTKDIIISNALVIYDSSERFIKPIRNLVTYPIPSGVNIYARLQCSGAIDAHDVAIYLTGG